MKSIMSYGKWFTTFSFICLFLSSVVNAQIKVDLTGRVKVGPERLNQDRDSVVNLMIFGKNGDYRAGGKLSFGDFGTYVNNSRNVFIGEYGTTDTDQLWLHGKIGTYFTYGNSSFVWGHYDLNAGNAFRLNCDVYSNGILLTSDERLKENIRPLNGSLPLLQQLNGVSYFLKTPIMRTEIETQATGDSSLPSEKEQRDMAFFEKWEKELQDSKDLRMGFVAQELRKVFPELVSEDKQGMLSVDYIGLIPVIVESIKEQQQIIDAQSEKIKEMENAISMFQEDGAMRSSPNKSGATGVAEQSSKLLLNGNLPASLYQNTPNPFNQSTQIKYYLPETISSAYLCIYDLQGKQLKQITIAERGEGSQTISASEFSAGIYLYALLSDGKEIDVKRMIFTE